MAVAGISMLVASLWEALRKDVADLLAITGVGLIFLAMLLTW